MTEKNYAVGYRLCQDYWRVGLVDLFVRWQRVALLMPVETPREMPDYGPDESVAYVVICDSLDVPSDIPQPARLTEIVDCIETSINRSFSGPHGNCPPGWSADESDPNHAPWTMERAILAAANLNQRYPDDDGQGLRPAYRHALDSLLRTKNPMQHDALWFLAALKLARGEPRPFEQQLKWHTRRERAGDNREPDASIERKHMNPRDRCRPGADLWYADLRGADLRGVDLRDADLTGANLRDADLRDANLRGAGLRYATLWGVDLTGADLTGADLRYTDLRDASLGGGNFTGADLTGAASDGATFSKTEGAKRRERRERERRIREYEMQNKNDSGAAC